MRKWSCSVVSDSFWPHEPSSPELAGEFFTAEPPGAVLRDAKSLQLCPTLCNPMGCSSPGSSVHGFLQARKNTGVGCHALLQGIFPTQGSNLHLLCQPALAGRFFTTSATWETQEHSGVILNPWIRNWSSEGVSPFLRLQRLWAANPPMLLPGGLPTRTCLKWAPWAPGEQGAGSLFHVTNNATTRGQS